MDLIRIFSETAFAKVAERFLSFDNVSKELESKGKDLDESFSSYVFPTPSFPLPEDFFIDQARLSHPELSDDTLRMIYQLGVDDWSHFGYENSCSDDCNILQVLACMGSQVMEDTLPYPQVHFRDLFRWREITQVLGEDLLTCAFLAYHDRNIKSDSHRRYDWPSVLHNDNPHLNYLFREKKLCELHSHLKASTNTFEISWVCLMNHIAGRDDQFRELARIHEPSRKEKLYNTIYTFIAEAANIRWSFYRYIKDDDISFVNDHYKGEIDLAALDRSTQLERSLHSDSWIPDYICLYPDKPMSIYAGERWLLYSVLKRIYSSNNSDLTDLFYRYVLFKSLLRGYFVQINRNVGFSNFKRFQDIKSKFLKKDYTNLLTSLPLWEASAHNHTVIFETRIAPPESLKRYLKTAGRVTEWIEGEEDFSSSQERQPQEADWGIIIHFLKSKERGKRAHLRNEVLRKRTKKSSSLISRFRSNPLTAGSALGIDAASSEFEAQPEVFGQSFRFLRHFGFNATFHAGEDFYDLADGLRAIDEAITFLELKSSDRIGHTLALGIDPEKYYSDRHDRAAIPKQYMLDNAVWLLMKSQEYGIAPDVQTNLFLHNTFKELATEIGYIGGGKERREADISDYWDSMALRGDNPDFYDANGRLLNEDKLLPDTWEYYGLLNNHRSRYVRNNNPEACRLFVRYHWDSEIRSQGAKVRSFQLPKGYRQLIKDLQEAMMRDLSKRQIGIECCPSSNVRIGRLERFDCHPIFRFFPVENDMTRYPLAVTVNTDDLGIFSTSLPNEFSLLALALLKVKNPDGTHRYSTQQVYDWIARVIENGHKFTFLAPHRQLSHD